jgi:hypothetical protein
LAVVLLPTCPHNIVASRPPSVSPPWENLCRRRSTPRSVRDARHHLTHLGQYLLIRPRTYKVQQRLVLGRRPIRCRHRRHRLNALALARHDQSHASLPILPHHASAQHQLGNDATTEMQKHFAKAYNRGDADAMAAAFTENATSRNNYGRLTFGPRQRMPRRAPSPAKAPG